MLNDSEKIALVEIQKSCVRHFQIVC